MIAATLHSVEKLEIIYILTRLWESRFVSNPRIFVGSKVEKLENRPPNLLSIWWIWGRFEKFAELTITIGK